MYFNRARPVYNISVLQLEDLCFCCSLADDMGTEPVSGSTSWHQRHDRLPYGSVPACHQLLGVRKCDDPADEEVRHGDNREQLQSAHEADYPRSEGQGFRQLQMHLEELTGGDGRLHPALRSVKTVGHIWQSEANTDIASVKTA